MNAIGGINTLGGLNNVSVDYRPVLEPTVQNTGNANQPQQAPGAEAAIENPPVERAEAKSVVRELDVLLLGAASKSIAANAAENVRTVGKSLVDKGVLTKKEASKLESLAMGLQSIALPEEIDEDFYNHLIAMDNDPAKKREYLNSIAPRISPEALSATEARLNEAIAHAKMLGQHGKVYGKEQWRNEANLKGMTGVKATVTIKTTDGSKVQFRNNIDCVNDYNERKCPSFFRREYLQNMFNPPADA